MTAPTEGVVVDFTQVDLESNMTGTREGVVVDFTQVDDSKLHPLGTELNGLDGNTYQYISSVGATAYYCYVLGEAGALTALATTTNVGAVPCIIVVPQVTITSGKYGWVVVKGQDFTIRAAASCAADVKLYTTANGDVDDTATTLIQSLRLNASPGGSAGNVSATATSYMRCNAQD